MRFRQSSETTDERIYVTFVKANGDGYTGGSPDCWVRQRSTGFYYDFNDNTFKGAAWTDIDGTMTELDSTNLPGTYYIDLTAAQLTADEYVIRAR